MGCLQGSISDSVYLMKFNGYCMLDKSQLLTIVLFSLLGYVAYLSCVSMDMTMG